MNALFAKKMGVGDFCQLNDLTAPKLDAAIKAFPSTVPRAMENGAEKAAGFIKGLLTGNKLSLKSL